MRGSFPQGLPQTQMTIVAYDQKTGRVTKAEHISAVNKLLKLKEKKSFWDVVEEVIKIWKKKEPAKWDAYLIHLDATKKDQKETSIVSKWRGVSRRDGIERSLVVDIPMWIIMCLRKLYSPNEWKPNKKFYREFARRFPLFRIREKV
jgi:predicted CopG family antitoxin